MLSLTNPLSHARRVVPLSSNFAAPASRVASGGHARWRACGGVGGGLAAELGEAAERALGVAKDSRGAESLAPVGVEGRVRLKGAAAQWVVGAVVL